ncbi:hypothetical protein HJC23_009776 [Cyclotella cryptica]|uniref:Uncharacterized protein n=1 Tax=Cyclotella cryptica TaxID=29204 RepID=A0ABD3PSH8_9STRA
MPEEASPQSKQPDSKEETSHREMTGNTPLGDASPKTDDPMGHKNEGQPTAGDVVDQSGEGNAKENSSVEASVLGEDSPEMNHDDAPRPEDGLRTEPTLMEMDDDSHNPAPDAYLCDSGSIDMASTVVALPNDEDEEAIKAFNTESDDSLHSNKYSTVLTSDGAPSNDEGACPSKFTVKESVELEEYAIKESGNSTGTGERHSVLADETEGIRSAEKTPQMECNDEDELLLHNESDESTKSVGGLHDVVVSADENKEPKKIAAPDRLLDDKEKGAGVDADPTVAKRPSEKHSSDDASDGEACAFELLGIRKRKKKKSTPPLKPIPISISLPHRSGNDIRDGGETEKENLVAVLRSIPIDDDDEGVVCNNVDCSDEDSEDERVGKSKATAVTTDDLQIKLAELQAEKDADLAKIKAFLDAKWKERNKEMQSEIKRIRGEMLAKQERQRKQLASNHKKKLEAEEVKVDQAIEWLLREQKVELNTRMLKHQQEKQKMSRSQDKMTEWDNLMSNLRDRHREQVRQLESKKIELKKKSELEFKAQSNILSTHHKKRQLETDRHADELAKQCIEVHNEGIIVMTRSSDGDHPKSKRMSIFLPWSSKARRVLYSVMCGEIPSEISNLYFTGGKDLDGGLVRCMITDMRTSEDTAICDRAESYLNHLSSKRESEISRLSKQHIALNKQISEVSAEYKNAVKLEEGAIAAAEEATKAHKESQETWERFKSLFNEDGSLSANVSSDNRQNLFNAMHRYKEAFESTKSQMNSMKKPLEGARVSKLTKKMELEKLREQLADIDGKLKKLRRDSSPSKVLKSARAIYSHDFGKEDTRGRIDDIITAIHLTADKRRAIVNEKKTNSNIVCSVWDKKMDEFGMDSSLKKSIWQKMQRKRINTVLRPSQRNIVQNILNESKSSVKTSRWFDMGPDDDPIIGQSLRTEEMILLALHPAPPTDSLSPVLHEPGWHLCLDTPQDMKRNSSSILPVDMEGLVSQSFLSVCCSTGHQAASLLHPHHLRTLSINTPSTFSYNASSLAESNPTYHQRATADTIYADPLSESEEQIQLGYSFVVRGERKQNTVARTSSSGMKTHFKNQKQSKVATIVPSVSKSKPAVKKPAAKTLAAKKPAAKKPAVKKHKIDKPKSKTKSVSSKQNSNAEEEKSSHRQQKHVSQQLIDPTLNDTGMEAHQQIDPRYAERNNIFQKNEQIGIAPTMNPAGEQQQYQQLLMARKYLQMFNQQQQQSSSAQNYGRQEDKVQQQQQQQQQQSIQHQVLQGQQGQYVQADQRRLGFSQPQVSQFMQNNMMGNNSQLQNGQQHLNMLNHPNFQHMGKPAGKK